MESSMNCKILVSMLTLFSIQSIPFAASKTVWTAKDNVPIVLEHGHPPIIIIDGCKLPMENTTKTADQLEKEYNVGPFTPYPTFGTWSRALGRGWSIKDISKTSVNRKFSFSIDKQEGQIENICMQPNLGPNFEATATSISIPEPQQCRAIWNLSQWRLPEEGKGVILFSTASGTSEDIICSIAPASSYHIGMDENQNPKPPLYQVVIGGEHNSKSWIRKESQGPPVNKPYQKKIIDSTKEQNWWIIINNGLITVGEGSIPGANEFMRYKDTAPLNPLYVGFSNKTKPVHYANINFQRAPGGISYHLHKMLKGYTPFQYGNRWTIEKQGTLNFDVANGHDNLKIHFDDGREIWLGYGTTRVGLAQDGWVHPESNDVFQSDQRFALIGTVEGSYKLEYDLDQGIMKLSRSDLDDTNTKSVYWKSDKLKSHRPLKFTFSIYQQKGKINNIQIASHKVNITPDSSK
jgi:hypothetical protein